MNLCFRNAPRTLREREGRVPGGGRRGLSEEGLLFTKRTEHNVLNNTAHGPVNIFVTDLRFANWIQPVCFCE